MISKKEVEHIAKLARLKLTKKEIEKFQKDISEILDYFELLKEVDVKNIEPTSHSIKIENVARKDEERPEEIERVGKLIEATPEKKERYIRVKAVL